MATLRRTEAKAFFANERTFLHWMNMSVTLGSISAALLGEFDVRGGEEEDGGGWRRAAWGGGGGGGLLSQPPPDLSDSLSFFLSLSKGVSGVAHKSWGRAYEGHAVFVRSMATGMMCLSIFMAVYAARNFKVRGDMLQLKADGPYDSRLLPVLLACVLIASLLLVFGGAVAELAGWA